MRVSEFCEFYIFLSLICWLKKCGHLNSASENLRVNQLIQPEEWRIWRASQLQSFNLMKLESNKILLKGSKSIKQLYLNVLYDCLFLCIIVKDTQLDREI